MENEVLIQLLTDIKGELAKLNQTASDIKQHCDRMDRTLDRNEQVAQLRRLTNFCNELAKEYNHYAQALEDMTSDDFAKAHLADIYHGQFAGKYGRELDDEALDEMLSKYKEKTEQREKLFEALKKQYPELVFQEATTAQEIPRRKAHKEEEK